MTDTIGTFFEGGQRKTCITKTLQHPKPETFLESTEEKVWQEFNRPTATETKEDLVLLVITA